MRDVCLFIKVSTDLVMSTHKIKIVAGFTDRNDNLDAMLCNETQFDLAPKICQHKFSHGKKLVYENRQI